MLGLVHCNNVSGVSAFSSWKHKGTKEINEQSKEREREKKKTIPELVTPIKPPKNKVQKATFAFNSQP